ncbi:MAG: imidazolonepropionase [Pseudomonadota bacterium]
MLLTNATLATMHGGTPYGLVNDGTVWIDGETIKWVGVTANVPPQAEAEEQIDCEGRLITPGLVDCHTHIVFGGNRAKEFEMRLNGASYEEIARAGGGIVSTVSATDDASENSLLEDALERVDALIAEGITTLEIKSGYGLDTETELKMLRVARSIGSRRRISIKTSFLGAHAIPTDYADRPDAYIDEVCVPTLKAAHDEGLVDAVDGFCEGIAFNPAQIRKVFESAASLGLPTKLHAEQLSNMGGTQLAAEFEALSADHLEYATDSDAQAMARAGSVAVILPGAFYTLRETQVPPIASFRRHGVPMALATDCNPGSSPVSSLLLTMNMACTLFRMTPEEALTGVTKHGAKALGLSDRGAIVKGARADLAIWNVKTPAELSYRIGFNPLHMRLFKGTVS